MKPSTPKTEPPPSAALSSTGRLTKSVSGAPRNQLARALTGAALALRAAEAADAEVLRFGLPPSDAAYSIEVTR